MSRIRTNISDIGISFNCNNINITPHISEVNIAGEELTAVVNDNLSEEQYEKACKEIRVLYSFCFEHVYSEDYEINTLASNISHCGHNERKKHLLSEDNPVTDKFGSVCKQLFQDILETSLGQSKHRSFFNSAFIWARARELEDLDLFTEAYTQYWRLLDLICEKSNISQNSIRTLLGQYSLANTQSNVFALKILHKMSRLDKNSKNSIESLALLDSLRHPHAHQASDRVEYYLEEETHLEAEMHNIFIADITKLFVIHEIGLSKYYLKPRANIYELAKL